MLCSNWPEPPGTCAWAPPHLLTLRPLEVHVAVTLAALGGRAQLPEPVGLGRLGQADVPEGSGGDHHVGIHAIDVWTQRPSSRTAELTATLRFSLDKHLLFTSLSKEFTFPSFSSASSLDDIVPVDEVLGIFVMSPRKHVCLDTFTLIKRVCFSGSVRQTDCNVALRENGRDSLVLTVGDARAPSPTTLSSLTVEPQDLWTRPAEETTSQAS